jgi:mono/diheme cytochrome c family protein
MIVRVFGLVLAAGLSASPLVAGAPGDLVERGAYLAKIMDCQGCHMPRAADGALVAEAGLSGGTVGFELPGLGIFWPPNITPSAAGIGDWSDDDVLTAIRSGMRPDGRALVPVMPWPSYAEMTDDDAEALVAYLRAQPAVDTPAPGPVASSDEAKAPFYRVTLP